MKKASCLLATLALILAASICQAQEVSKAVLERVRSVSVSIEINGKCAGSGTLFDKEDETWCVTAAHVIADTCGCGHRPIVSVAQYREGKKPVSVYAKVESYCKESDVAILKVGRGVFGPGTAFYKGKKPPVLDTPIVHCGSMLGLHHTLTRGYLVGHDRKIFGGIFDHADFTGSYGSSGGGVFLTDGRFIGMVTCGDPQRIVMFVPIRRIKGLD